MPMCLSFFFFPLVTRVRDAPNKIIVFTIIQKVTSGNIAVTIYRHYQNISQIYVSSERSRTLAQITIYRMRTK